MGDFLDDVEPGQVVVIDNGGRDWCTVWGDIMSLDANLKGVSGTIIDGVCRDLPAIERIGYPIYSKGVYMVTGKDRVYVDAVDRFLDKLAGVADPERFGPIEQNGGGIVPHPFVRRF